MGVTGFYLCLVLRYDIMGSHTPSSENLSPYLCVWMVDAVMKGANYCG